MTGVSYMIPFVAAGGLLIALSFLVAGYEIAFKGEEIATKNSLFDLPNLAELELSEVPFDIDRLAGQLMHDKAANPSNYAMMTISEGATFATAPSSRPPAEPPRANTRFGSAYFAVSGYLVNAP